MHSDLVATKARIRAEFSRCLRETAYRKITVKELALRLGMSRQNFYRYYFSKEEILLDTIDDMFDRIYQMLDVNFHAIDDAPDLLIQQLFSITVPSKAVIAEVLDRGTDDVVFAHMQNFVRRILGRLARSKDKVISDHEYFDILVSKIAAGSFFAIKTWSQADIEISERKFKALFMPMLQDILVNLPLAWE